MIQGSDEWRMARLGKLTASRVVDMMAKTKSGPSASRKNLVAALVCERLTGQPGENYTNAAMQWGIEHEPEARALYELTHGTQVEQVGFIPHPTIPMAGASPDGLVGTNGGLEIKCPSAATHIDFLKTGVIERAYLFQMQWGMACTGRLWWDFMSYCPLLPGALMAKVVRVERDSGLIVELQKEAVDLLNEVEEGVLSLRSMM